MLNPKILRGKIFLWMLTQKNLLRIFIITFFQNQNIHSASIHTNGVKLWALNE